MLRLAALCLLLSALPASAQSLRNDLWVTNGGVNASTVVGNTLYLGGSFSRVGPATGGLMPVHATTAQPALAALDVDGQINALAADGMGGWYVGGAFLHVRGVARTSLARIDRNGNVLPWNPDCQGVVRAMVRSGNKLYLGGTFASVGGQSRANLAVVDTMPAASVLAWNPNVNSEVDAIGLSGSLAYIGGGFTTVGGVPRAHLAAVDVNTGAASAWQPNPDGDVYTLSVRYDVIDLTTDVYVGGSFSAVAGIPRSNFAMISATVGAATYGQPNAFHPDPNGAVRKLINFGNTIPVTYVGGDFTSIAGQPRARLASFSGTTLSAWNPGADNTVTAMTLSGSTMYVGGYFDALGGASRAFAGAVTVPGGVATAWDPQPNGPVRVFAAVDTTVWLGGDLTSLGGVARANLAALDLATGQATAWNPGTNGPVNALEAIGGLLYAGGAFTTAGGQGRPHVVQLGTNGSVGAWNPAPDGDVLAIAGRSDLTQSTIYLGGKFTSVMSTPRIRLAAVTDDAVSPQLLAWNPNVDGEVDALLYDAPSSRIYVGGAFANFGGGIYPRKNLAWLDTAGLPSGWTPNPQAPIHGLAASNGVVYAGFSGQVMVGGALRRGIAAISAASGNALPWDPNCNGSVNTILPYGGTLYLGGFFTLVGGQSRWNLAQVDAATAAVLPFNAPSWSWPVTFTLGALLPGVNDLALAGNRLYASGFFKSILGKPHSAIAGIVDPLVDAPPLPTAAALSLRAMPNPARATQVIVFALPVAAVSTIEVHDVAGRLVRRLASGRFTAGEHRIEWDGLSASGARVHAGIFFARIETAGEQATIKLVRLAK